MSRLAVLVPLACTLAIAGCEKSSPREEAPIRKGSPLRKPPRPPTGTLAAEPTPPTTPPPTTPPPTAPPVDPDAVATAPGGSAPVAIAAGDDDTVRPPTAADLAGYVKGLPGKGKLTATIETTLGTFHCELYEKQAPMTVANFVGLATGRKPWINPRTGDVMRGTPFFNGLAFHRVIPDFMIQGGDPLGRGTGGPGYTFEDEFDPKLRHTGAGIMSMANSGKATNGSQFFITEKATPWLDDRHTVFGKCAEGGLVKKITGVPRDGRDRPLEPVSIVKVTIGRR